MKSTCDFTYDDAGQLIRELYTDANGAAYTTEYTYDADGHVTHEVFHFAEAETYTYAYTYDAHGNRIGEKWTDTNGEVEITDIRYVPVYIPFDLSDNVLALIGSLFYWE